MAERRILGAGKLKAQLKLLFCYYLRAISVVPFLMAQAEQCLIVAGVCMIRGSEISTGRLERFTLEIFPTVIVQ